MIPSPGFPTPNRPAARTSAPSNEQTPSPRKPTQLLTHCTSVTRPPQRPEHHRESPGRTRPHRSSLPTHPAPHFPTWPHPKSKPHPPPPSTAATASPTAPPATPPPSPSTSSGAAKTPTRPPTQPPPSSPTSTPDTPATGLDALPDTPARPSAPGLCETGRKSVPGPAVVRANGQDAGRARWRGCGQRRAHGLSACGRVIQACGRTGHPPPSVRALGQAVRPCKRGERGSSDRDAARGWPGRGNDAHSCARRRGHGSALAAVWLRLAGRVVQLPAIHAGPRPCRPSLRTGKRVAPAKKLRPEAQKAAPAEWHDCGRRSAVGGRRSAVNARQTVPRSRTCDGGSQADTARSQQPGAARGRPMHAPGHPVRDRGLCVGACPRCALPGDRIPTTGPSSTVSRASNATWDRPSPGAARPARTRRPARGRPARGRPARGRPAPIGPTTPTNLAPTSCGDARPSVPCAAPHG